MAVSGLLIIMDIEKIIGLLPDDKRAVIAIDGRCASGKTTLAGELAKRLGGEVVHCDDFFLPRELRTGSRLGEPGGNFHRERFISEVIEKLGSGEPFEYGVFDCSAFSVSSLRKIENTGVIIVEGAYCLHPDIPDIYDLRVFLSVSPEEQLYRIEKRNGAAALKAFREKWIPMEERYFAEFGIKDKCDLVIE